MSNYHNYKQFPHGTRSTLFFFVLFLTLRLIRIVLVRSSLSCLLSVCSSRRFDSCCAVLTHKNVAVRQLKCRVSVGRQRCVWLISKLHRPVSSSSTASISMGVSRTYIAHTSCLLQNKSQLFATFAARRQALFTPRLSQWLWSIDQSESFTQTEMLKKGNKATRTIITTTTVTTWFTAITMT